MTTEYSRPLPRPQNPELTRPYWEAAKRHELVIPRCRKCAHLFFYPRFECPRCFSTDLEWAKMSGEARVHTFTIVRQPVNPAFLEDVPYIYALVQLNEGPRLISNVVQCDIDDVKIDMPLTVFFDDVTSDWTLVKFRPAD